MNTRTITISVLAALCATACATDGEYEWKSYASASSSASSSSYTNPETGEATTYTVTDADAEAGGENAEAIATANADAASTSFDYYWGELIEIGKATSNSDSMGTASVVDTEATAESDDNADTHQEGIAFADAEATSDANAMGYLWKKEPEPPVNPPEPPVNPPEPPVHDWKWEEHWVPRRWARRHYSRPQWGWRYVADEGEK